MSDTAKNIALKPSRNFRRVLTGHNENNRSTIVSDTEFPAVVAVWCDNFVIADAWRADSLPDDNFHSAEPCKLPLELEASPTGNVLRMVQFPPDREYVTDVDPSKGFDALGDSGSGAITQQNDDDPHPLMHKTNTVDYIIIVSGEIYAVMEEKEVLLKQGDVLVQRGTNHAWSNRSDKPCVLAAILNAAHAPAE